MKLGSSSNTIMVVALSRRHCRCFNKNRIKHDRFRTYRKENSIRSHITLNLNINWECITQRMSMTLFRRHPLHSSIFIQPIYSFFDVRRSCRYECMSACIHCCEPELFVSQFRSIYAEFSQRLDSARRSHTISQPQISIVYYTPATNDRVLAVLPCRGGSLWYLYYCWVGI